MVPNDLDADIINLKKHADFKGREKEIYRFAFKTETQQPEIDEIMEKLELLEQANLKEAQVTVTNLAEETIEFGGLEEAESFFY